jgi:hypothetical protein
MPTVTITFNKMTRTIIKLLFLGLPLAFGFTHRSEAATLCDLISEKAARTLPAVNIRGIAGPVKVPIGVDPRHFKSFLEQTLSLKEVDAVMVFGSRTHFSYGYFPTAKSDLDVHVFFKDTPGASLATSTGQVNKIVAELQSASDFEITTPLLQWGVDLYSGMEASARSFSFPLSRAEERAIFEKAEKDGQRDFFFKRKKLKNRIHEALAAASGYDRVNFNKEALIFIKHSPAARKSFQTLYGYGFRNIYYQP